MTSCKLLKTLFTKNTLFFLYIVPCLFYSFNYALLFILELTFFPEGFTLRVA